MNEFGAALQFFEGFGENWYALEECLSYLDEWLQGDAYILVITNPLELLVEDGEELKWSNKVLNNAGDSSINHLSGGIYDASGNLTNWNGNTYAYDPFHLMWDYKTPSDEWLYFYTADDERAWSYKTDNTSLWTLRGPDAKVLREYANDLASISYGMQEALLGGGVEVFGFEDSRTQASH